MKPQPQTPPTKPQRLTFTAEEAAQIASAKLKREAVAVEPEWQVIAEMGVLYGFDAVMAIINNEITFDEMTQLVKAGRKIRAKETLDLAQANFISSVAAASKNPSVTFKKLAKGYIEAAK